MSSKLSKEKTRRYVVLSLPTIPRPVRNLSLIAVLVVGSNVLSHSIWNNETGPPPRSTLEFVSSSELYLMDKARIHIADHVTFEAEVRAVAEALEIPPEWLMAVMYAESAFDPSIVNRQGSGAVGLIQFMPATAQELHISVERLRKMSAAQQMKYVHRYLHKVQERYGSFESLTDLYLAILYPKARKKDACYRLYADPSRAYQQNAILDENKDGQVTIADIDKRLLRLFPTAYQQTKAST